MWPQTPFQTRKKQLHHSRTTGKQGLVKISEIMVRANRLSGGAAYLLSSRRVFHGEAFHHVKSHSDGRRVAWNCVAGVDLYS